MGRLRPDGRLRAVAAAILSTPAGSRDGGTRVGLCDQQCRLHVPRSRRVLSVGGGASMQQGPQVFRTGGSVLRMFQVLTVAGFGMSGLLIYGAVMGAEPGWPAAAISFLGALLMLGLCLVVPGVMTVSEDGIQVKQRFGTQRLRWSEIQSVRWSGHGGGDWVGLLASAASDNWQVWIRGAREDLSLRPPRGAAGARPRAARGAATFEGVTTGCSRCSRIRILKAHFSQDRRYDPWKRQ